MKKMMLGLMIVLSVFLVVPVGAISEAQETAIVTRCDTIKDNLKVVQRLDSRARVYLGRYYETILSKFIMPLNVRLVENNLSDNDLLVNQDSFAKAQESFKADYITYQKSLEDLVAMNCKEDAESFYAKLQQTREKRKIVAEDTVKLRSLAVKQKELVLNLRGRL